METVAFDCSASNGQVWSRDGLFRCIRYDSGAASGGVTPTVRVRSLVGQAYDCELVPGRQVTIPDAARGILVQNISGGAVLTGKITLGAGQITDNSIVGEVSLNAAALAALEQINVRPEGSTGNFKSIAALAALASEVVIAPGANTAGAVVLSASGSYGAATTPAGVFIAKGSAPASITDGEVIAAPLSIVLISASIYENIQLPKEQYLAAGLGLYFISTAGVSAGGIRAARFKLL